MIYLLLLSIAGLVDSSYLTWEHYSQVIPPCAVHPFIPSFLVDCGKVLTSSYSIMFGIPLAVLGLIHYSLLTLLIISSFFSQKKLFRYFIVLQTIIGAFASLYFMYIQIGIIGSICLYCTLSAIISFIILIIAYRLLKKERFELHLGLYAIIYQKILKPFFFILDPEFIHNQMIYFGSILGDTPLIKFIGSKFVYNDKSLKQKITGINFDNPVGLAAGFDYNSDLTQTLYYLDFGFQTVGTITNLPYKGNPPPRLGRLTKSKSLMVNKGFKNIGVEEISKKIKDLNFKIPTGISIGVTNSKDIKTIKNAIEDIVSAFKIFEKSKIKNSYYELNISCPNLINNKSISFYPPSNLDLLLTAVDKLKTKKPIFVKMPIEKSNQELLKMLKIIVNHKSINGIIIGNLMKDRKNPDLVLQEVKKFKVGNFSGKPCEKRSNELIRLAYENYKNRLVIIGCGGVFSADDAYRKIKLGASLVQLITGMIYQGPQLISQINLGLIDLLEKDGFKNISNAVGKSL